MKRIEARDATGRVMAVWVMDELDRAQQLVSLSESPWTLGVAEFESEAEADAKRLDHLERNGIPGRVEYSDWAPSRPISVWFWSEKNEWWRDSNTGAAGVAKPQRTTLREAIDSARNAPKPTFTPIETDTKPT